ncbi:hypothetical protein [Nitrobacter sp. JJSN]|uniref:hypothetical protein n=1 Tax=Nitrobacter sp. JJSN TaxID=3453033 RepID=UPI003F760E35
MAEMTWSRRFDEPIKTPDGKTPPHLEGRQHAAAALRNAAEREIAWMWFARPAMMRALLGSDSPPIGNPERKKGTRWRTKRALARDR